jgi:hypothetical protein
LLSINRSILVIFIFLSASTFNSAYSSELVWEFQAGSWRGAAYKDDSGRFSHCAIYAYYKNGITLFLGLTKSHHLRIMMKNDKWNLPEEERYQVRIRLDQQDMGIFEAYASSSDGLMVDLGNNSQIFKLLKQGNLLRLEASKETFSFRLNGTNNALTKVKEYVDMASSFSKPSTNPFSTENGNTSSDLGNKNKVGEDGPVIYALLNAAGMTDIQMVDPAKLNFSSADHAWVGDHIKGAVFTTGFEQGSLDESFATFLGAMAGSCTGDFGSQMGELITVGDAQIKQFYAFCSENEDLFIASTAMARNDYLLFIINFSDEKRADDLRTVNDNLRELFTSLFQKE